MPHRLRGPSPPPTCGFHTRRDAVRSTPPTEDVVLGDPTERLLARRPPRHTAARTSPSHPPLEGLAPTTAAHPHPDPVPSWLHPGGRGIPTCQWIFSSGLPTRARAGRGRDRAGLRRSPVAVLCGWSSRGCPWPTHAAGPAPRRH